MGRVDAGLKSKTPPAYGPGQASRSFIHLEAAESQAEPALTHKASAIGKGLHIPAAKRSSKFREMEIDGLTTIARWIDVERDPAMSVEELQVRCRTEKTRK
jgi:hypothetical protein